ncbi:MAG: transglycosylase SLT domain-containing protein [Actinomycetota bacterium]
MRTLAFPLLVLALVAHLAAPVNASELSQVEVHAELVAKLDAAADGAATRLAIARDDREAGLRNGIPARIAAMLAVVGISIDDLAFDDATIALISTANPELGGAIARTVSAQRSLANARAARDETEAQLIASLTSRPTVTEFRGSVERWRPVVQRYFRPEDVRDALSVMECESGGDPTARSRRSSAQGLFQFIRGTWKVASAGAGVSNLPSTDPEASIAAAAWLVDLSRSSNQDAWHHWSCKP